MAWVTKGSEGSDLGEDEWFLFFWLLLFVWPKGVTAPNLKGSNFLEEWCDLLF
jgi:hypothetical protein